MVCWKLVYRFSTYLWRIGSNLAQNFLTFLLNSEIWLSIVKVVATFIAVVTLSSIAQKLSPRAVAYLQSTTSVISEDNLLSLGWFALGFVGVLILLIVICMIWNLVDTPDDKAVFCAVIILIVWASTGFLMFALSRWDKTAVLGSGYPGVFTLTIWALVIVIAVINLAKGIALKIPEFVGQPIGQPVRNDRTAKMESNDAVKVPRRPLRRRLEIAAAITFVVAAIVLYRSSLNQLRTTQEERNEAQQLVTREQLARKEAEKAALIERASRENAEKAIKLAQDAKIKAEHRANQCEQELYGY